MADRKVQPGSGHEQRARHLSGLRLGSERREAVGQGGQAVRNPSVEDLQKVSVLTVDESWWPTRVRQGVHVLKPSRSQLVLAMIAAYRAGTNTVYAYRSL